MSIHDANGTYYSLLQNSLQRGVMGTEESIFAIMAVKEPHLYKRYMLDEKTGVGILLNTSFNVNGKPILSTIHDAFKIFYESQMDALIIEDYFILKK